MRCELPTVRRCCHCVPLRFGILGIGCVKVVVNLILLPILFGRYPNVADATELYSIGILVVLFVNDLIFNFVLIYGCRQKDPIKLQIFSRYSLFFLFFNIVCLLFVLVLDFLRLCATGHGYLRHSFRMTTSSLWTSVILLNLYLVILVKSEVMKLENETKAKLANPDPMEMECIEIK